MKILLIEDNRAISKGLVYTLEQNGFEVALCENAESTLNSLGGDFDKKQVCKNGNPVVLTALEYRLFAMLAKNSGKVLTREQILERIWDLSRNYVEDNTLTVYIKRLRKKLDTNMIKTVKGLGYRLEV